MAEDPDQAEKGFLQTMCDEGMALSRSLGGTRDADRPAWVFAGVPVGIAIGAAAVVLPLRAGARALRATEF